MKNKAQLVIAAIIGRLVTAHNKRKRTFITPRPRPLPFLAEYLTTFNQPRIYLEDENP